ncbi:AMP-binding protein [Shewanella sp. SR44-4]|uniref:AMP-binding protein n=1 Tax=unclassified Shewanella TaxID=196818 RepID=UPI000C31D2D3|nr:MULTISPECIES: AMP-binding protein [unclassified Shewanella]MBB1364578.1 AMP-binding protein [Shewanella sp. SR44-4]MBO1896751.1 AMP-binding protein [Shewanella sp. BF02_Schw]PKH29361.1 AMP-binding protein [Shewanella sp. ALD9]
MVNQHQAQLPLTQSEYHGVTSTTLTDKTIGQYFDDIASAYPDNLAVVVHHQQIRWNYREFQAKVDALATGLLTLGIQPGDRVGIWSPNNIEWCLTQFATAKIGAIMVCINPAYRPEELEYSLSNVGCRAVICADKFKSSDYLQMLNELLPELSTSTAGKLTTLALPELEYVIRMGTDRTPGMLNFNDLLLEVNDEAQHVLATIADALDTHDAINIQFTSGTTGSPKGATLSHHNILNNAYLVADAMGFTSTDKLCMPVPLYHCFGMVLGSLACVIHASAAVYPGESFDPLTTLQVIANERCTALHGVPTMFIAELEHPQFNQFDLSSLRTGIMAGATCPEEVMRRVQELMYMKEVLIGYGQTECSPLNHITEIDSPIEKQVLTVGRALPHTEVKIINEFGDVVAIGQPGEVCSRGYCIMQGYWNDAVKTAATIDSAGWLHSGDIGQMDELGYVQIVGRIKDMIIRGGENIYPREIEEKLYSHKDVQDAAVFGVQSDKYGEEVCAWIKVRANADITEDDIRHFLTEKFAYFKVPRYIKFVDQYPMTVTGKIQKFKMRELMYQELHEAIN